MSLPPSVALEHNGNPLVVRNTFIDIVEVHEVPKFVKLATSPAACQGTTTTADLPECVVHAEPLCQVRSRLLTTARVGNTDACSCGDLVTKSDSDASDVASLVSTKVPSEIPSTVNVCGSSDSDPNGLCSHPMGIQPWVSGQGIAAGEERGDRTTLMFRNLPESFTRCKLEELLNAEGFATRFNFLYLPADLKTGACFCYAFVNMVTPSDARSFMERFQGFQEWPVPSSKRAEVHMNERLQSIGDLIERYRNSPMMHPSVPHALRPAIYFNGCEMPFPGPTAPVTAPRTKNRKKARQ